MSDINMTPLIDVMLVLLVIFMIAAPLMTSSLKLELPKVAAAKNDGGGAALALSITPDGKLHLGDAVVTHDDLVRALRQSASRQPQPDVQLSADKSVPYGRVAELIGLVHDAGLTRIGFVAQPSP
jgi:biopolymer transport protein TolR